MAKAPRLSKLQKQLLDYIDNYSHNGYFYCECGPYKGVSARTCQALYDKGLIRVLESSLDRFNGYFQTYGVYDLVRA